MRIYTLGYQGLSVAEYIRLLRASGIGIILDVRENPWSYRPEFVGSTLKGTLTLARIDYAHIRAAGNPATNRRTATSAEECLERYRLHLSNNRSCLEELYSFIRYYDEQNRPACLTCYESDKDHCHRSVLQPIHLPLTEPIARKTQSLHKTAFIHPSLLGT
jgi:uncharacterized protein (DUF488 family)